MSKRTTTRSTRWLLGLCALLLLCGPALVSAQVSFNVMVALGDNYTAGMVSNALVETRQANSFPALIARQAAAPNFIQPLVSQPGIFTELEVKRLYPTLLIAPKSDLVGSLKTPTLPGSFSNLGIPGATANDLAVTDAAGGGFYSLILRDMGPATTQTVRLRPTLVLLWTGNADVMNAILTGRAIDGTTLTTVDKFKTSFTAIVTSLKATGATIMAANIPDLLTLPFVTTVKPYVVNPSTGAPVLINGQRVPLIGPNGIPLPSTALVTMAASRAILNGDGIPVAAGGRGTSLADEVVIDPNEAAIIAERIAAHNRNITDICKLAAIPLVDINVFSQEIATTGRMVGGHLLNNALLTGGVYSYDGIHPTELGYALIANEWIQVINKYGTNLSLVNLLPYLMAGNTGTSASTMTAGIESPAIGPLEFSEEAHRALLAVFPPVDQR